jgi:hypothetical protein
MAYDDAGRVEVVHRPGDPLPSPLRVRAGDEVVVRLNGSPGYGWARIEVVTGPSEVLTADLMEGSVRAVVRANGPGEAELRSTSSFRGDRFGPQTRLWRLLVHVEAS